MVAGCEMAFPVPEAAPHVAPAPLGEQVQLTPVIEAGTVSAMVALVAVDGPALETTMVYVTAVPGIALVMPSVFVMARLACGVTLSVSVAALLVVLVSKTPDGNVAVAVFINVLVPAGVAGLSVPITVYVALPPAATVAEVLMEFPVPLAAEHEDEAVAAQLHVTPVNAAGTVSTTVIPDDEEGPELATTTV